MTIFLTLLLPIIIYTYIEYTFKKNNCFLNITASQYARIILDNKQKYNIDIQVGLSNYFYNNIVYLTNYVYNSNDLFSVCISIFICNQLNLTYYKFKNKIIQIIKVLSTFFYWFILISYILNIYYLFNISVITMILCIIIMIIIYPLEYKNYIYTYKLINEYDYINKKYKKNYKKILLSITLIDIAKLIIYPLELLKIIDKWYKKLIVTYYNNR